MQRSADRADVMRIVALRSTPEPRRARRELLQSFALLTGAVVILAAVVGFLLLRSPVAMGPSSRLFARLVLGALGLSTGALAYSAGKLFLRRSNQLTERRLRIEGQRITFLERGAFRSGAAATRAPGTESGAAQATSTSLTSTRAPSTSLTSTRAPSTSLTSTRAPLTSTRAKSTSPATPETELLDFSHQFGATLFANRKRTRLVLAVTTSRTAAYFGARVDSAQRYAHRALLARASTVADDDSVLDATGPDGKPLELELSDLTELVTLLARADGRAFDRCFLSDTRGNAVVLDSGELRIGAKSFDLRAPLEWRAIVFQEPFKVMVALSDSVVPPQSSGGVLLYQGTCIRQGGSEAVLVSLLPSLASTPSTQPVPPGEVPEVASAILRDARLMQANPETPPAHELRVGIERTYMVRLRAALDRAPRASHKDLPAGARVR